MSSYQLDTDHRGFSFNSKSDLDMRMNQKSNICAKQIINSYKEVDLNKLFKEYADFKNPSRITSVIIKNRAIKEIKSVSDLTSILSEIFKGPKKKQTSCQSFSSH